MLDPFFVSVARVNQALRRRQNRPANRSTTSAIWLLTRNALGLRYFVRVMRVGIQTISWGPRPRSIETMLGEAKRAGYEGVELMQDLGVLGEPEHLLAALKKHDLTLLGFSGGSVEERIDYVRKMKRLMGTSPPPFGFGIQLYLGKETTRPYVYVDEWREDYHAPLLRQTDVVLALHPHMFKTVQTANEAARVLNAHSELRFLPDTAHLTVAGDDPVRIIELNFSRLAAVHLKDWTAEFGRAYQFYARGFTHLGMGAVPVKEVVGMLGKKKYVGWLVVEQDWAASPFDSAQASRVWLQATIQEATAI
jgi:inosose dehydratase